MSSQRIVITGGAGFLSSHLAEELLRRGNEVVVLDNFITGNPDNLAALPQDHLTIIKQDVTTFLAIDGPVDLVLHFASPASPIDYLKLRFRPSRSARSAPIMPWGLQRPKTHAFCWLRPRRCMEIRMCIRRPRTTGGMSTRSGRAVCMMKPSGLPRRWLWPTTAPMGWRPALCAFSTPMDRG
ncbi:MAG: NAD-dependent epimerase/dehydratase family protein [Candidatus Omnitrophica bacterium]|nr:NAD-dependent epimerase/dehydratase family protein [Candidatus Omnitrophota bacterium]